MCVRGVCLCVCVFELLDIGSIFEASGNEDKMKTDITGMKTDLSYPFDEDDYRVPGLCV